MSLLGVISLSMNLVPVNQGLSSPPTRGRTDISPRNQSPDRVTTGAEAPDPGLMPKPGFFGETATSQLTSTGVYVHRGVNAPVLTPGRGDQAYFAAGGSLFRMAPDGSVTEMGKESSLNISTPLVGADDTLYYRTDAGQVVARGADGEEKWRQADSGTSYYPMGLGQDGQSLYTVNVSPDGRHHVSVRELATGSEKYPLTLQPGEQMVGLVDERTLLVTGYADGDHYLQLVGPDGRGRKVGDLDSPVHGPNAWLGDGNQAFVRDKLGRLNALEASTGHKNWTYPGPMKDLYLSPDGSMLAVMGNALTRLSADGETGWSGKAPGHVTSGSFDAKGNFFTQTAGQLAFLTPGGELETTPWRGSVRVSGAGTLYQVSSPDAPEATRAQGSLPVALASGALGFLGSALGGLLGKKGLKQAARDGADTASQAYGQAYQPGNPAPPGPNRAQGDHRVEAIRFMAKKDLLAAVQDSMQGNAPAIEERGGRVIMGGVTVRRKSGG